MKYISEAQVSWNFSQTTHGLGLNRKFRAPLMGPEKLVGEKNGVKASCETVPCTKMYFAAANPCI